MVKCMCDFKTIQFMQCIINDRYFNQKGKQITTVYFEGTGGVTDMVKCILNNYINYNKALLNQILINFY